MSVSDYERNQRPAAKLELVEGMAFQAETESGHTLTLDSSADVGGRERGPRPMEMLLVGLGACTGMDVISILRKMRQAVSSYGVEVDGERATEHPRIYTRIVVEHLVRGRNLDPERVRHAVELSATRYCPAAAMLECAARLETRYRI